MRLDLKYLGALALTLTACGIRNLDGEPASDTSDTGNSVTDPGDSGAPPVPTSDGDATSEPLTGSVTTNLPDPGSSTQPADDTGCGFICAPDMAVDGNDCPGTHQLDPDCPEGHKCTLDGDLGNTQCIEVMPDPKGLNEPCQMFGDFLSGLDDCGVGLICWDTDDNGVGVCLGLCDDSASGGGECVCADPTAAPVWCQECAVGLCLPGCDPIAQDCGRDEVCILNSNSSGFACTLDASGPEGQLDDPCEFANVCDPGLLCVSSTASELCDPGASGCCQPICDMTGAACPHPGQQCVPLLDPPLPGFENIGICTLDP